MLQILIGGINIVTITSIKSGNWSATSTWDTGTIPANGDAVIIAEGNRVFFDVNQSAFANGLLSMVINGILHFKYNGITYLKMNGNISGTGALYVSQVSNVDSATLVEGKNYTYQTMGTNINGVEEGLGGVMLENKGSIDEVESTPGSFYFNGGNNTAYIHTTEGLDPTNLCTVIKYIQRPVVGDESRCTLMFNATAIINVPVIRMYGWYPEREYTQLDADAELNATTIVLKEDLGLQAGDKIAIGSGLIDGNLTETAKGIYTVQSYNVETKTVILTGGLQTARLKDDYIAWVSRPITILRVSGTTAILPTTPIHNGVIVGVHVGLIHFSPYIAGWENWVLRHITIRNGRCGLFSPINALVEDCVITESSNASILHGGIGIARRCIGISANPVYASMTNIILEDNMMQNIFTFDGGLIVKGCVGKNISQGILGSGTYIDTLIDSGWTLNASNSSITKTEFINCIFQDRGNGCFEKASPTFYNCLFDVTDPNKEIKNYNNYAIPKHTLIQSFNHNRIEGNYKAWMKGGKIETENSKLKFICESEDYPVFRDYPILAPANRLAKFLIALTKDTPGIVSKLQIIDPTNDPLIDSTATPLAESIATNSTSNQQIGVAYKSSTPRQLILRILCQNSSGEVLVDTTRIDQSLAKKITSLN